MIIKITNNNDMTVLRCTPHTAIFFLSPFIVREGIALCRQYVRDYLLCIYHIHRHLSRYIAAIAAYR